MHTQNTLHLTDKQYKLAVVLLTTAEPAISNATLVDVMVSEGIRQYPAEQMVEQRARFYSETQMIDEDHPLHDMVSTLVDQKAA
jgi:hypothetical protein